MIRTLFYSVLLIQGVLQESAIPPQLQIASPPIAPVQTVSTGIVILDGTVNRDGRLINVRVLQGTNPFIQPSLQAIREWMFGPAEALRQEERISVTFIYRARGILAQAPHEFVLGGAAPLEGDRPPAPTTIVDPGYPVNSVGQGSVIVQARVSAQGTVERTTVVRPEPSLTDAAVDAVKRWKFAPASRGGEARPGLAIAVVSFQAPVLSSPAKQ